MLSMMEKMVALDEIELFDGLGSRARTELARRCTTEIYAAGMSVARPGHDAERLFAVIDGTAAVLDDVREIARIGPRELFGEVALYGPTVSARAVTDLVCLSLSRVDIYEAAGDDGGAALDIVVEVTCRLRARQQFPIALSATW